MCAKFVWSAVVIFIVITYVIADNNPYLDTLRLKYWDSDQNYVEIRPGAHMFYWLYYADGTRVDSRKKPLIIWIQGGPGLAASGIANFLEIGPLRMDMTPRNHTWVKGRNVLLIDHPVGTGFSYVKNDTLLVRTDREAVLDLARLIKAFFRKHKEFRQTPTYIFSQSYGGKLCPRLAYCLHTVLSILDWWLYNVSAIPHEQKMNLIGQINYHQKYSETGHYYDLAIQKKKLKMNFKGIGIGSGFVDPKESILICPQYLYMMGLLDRSVYRASMDLSHKIASLIEKKEYKAATKIRTDQYEMLYTEAGMNDFNNINEPSPYESLEVLADKVNAYVKPTLKVNQSLIWDYISVKVYTSLEENILVPSIKFLEMLLNNTELKIAVYNGNLDIKTPLAGASNWVHKLKWDGAQRFRLEKKHSISGNRNGFYKVYDKLSFWWVFKAGHWVPEDNPEAMEQILDYVINN